MAATFQRLVNVVSHGVSKKLRREDNNNDGYIWDEEVSPLFGDSFPAFPDAGGDICGTSQGDLNVGMAHPASVWGSINHSPVQGEGENTRSHHPTIPGPKGSDEEIDFSTAWKQFVESQRSVQKRRCCLFRNISCRCGRRALFGVVTVLLFIALLTFCPLLTLPLKDGNEAWPLGQGIKCQGFSARDINIRNILAVTSVIPMIVGVMCLIVFNLVMWCGMTKCFKPSVVASILSAMAYATYLAVVPYNCAALSTCAQVSLCCPFLHFLIVILVPILQKVALKDQKKKEKKRKERGRRNGEVAQTIDPLLETSPLLRPSRYHDYYCITVP